jgi:hypothetical protein
MAQVLDSIEGASGLRGACDISRDATACVRFPVVRPGIGRPVGGTERLCEISSPDAMACIRAMPTTGMRDAMQLVRDSQGRSSRCHQEHTMNAETTEQAERAEFELRFQSLFDAGRAYAFPCDAKGHVDMDRLSDRALANYFYARKVVGREVRTPSVQVRHA